MSARTSRPRLAIVFVVVVAVALAGFFGIRAIWHAAQQTFSSPHCDVGSYEIDTDQASVAAAMVGEVTRFRPALPDRAAVLTLAAGLQESKLTNLAAGAGDRDSVGVLQQRPSQGWGGGDATKLTDVTEATREFLAALVKVKNWEQRPLADAIQAVQISADGTAYAKHEPEAQALADALHGRKIAGISCTFDHPTKVAATRNVITQLRHELPVNRPRATGRTITVPGAGWQTAAWFVANADRLGVDSVRYRTRIWSREHGWQNSDGTVTDVVATMAQV